VSRRSLLLILIASGALVVAAFVGVVLATSGSSDDQLVIYSARSHYGEEKPFEDFAKTTGVDLRIRAGSASELYERLKSEGDDTAADVLITVDAANLWRAEEAGLLEPVHDPRIEAAVPRDLRDSDDEWFGLLLRARTIMRSTDRVEPSEVTTYEGLGDPKWKGRLCLRKRSSEYNVSFVADRLAKDGRAATERMLRRWMANDPQIFESDTEVLEKIADGDCDVGLTNHYYLERVLADDPDYPVAPVWADQQGRGTHVNLSGIGVVRGSDHAKEARALIEYILRPSEERIFVENNHEFPVRGGTEFKRDPINVAGAGEHLDEALGLMREVGWR
jgi:iron(III) transport system substrate-binding protein